MRIQDSRRPSRDISGTHTSATGSRRVGEVKLRPRASEHAVRAKRAAEVSVYKDSTHSGPCFSSCSYQACGCQPACMVSQNDRLEDRRPLHRKHGRPRSHHRLRWHLMGLSADRFSSHAMLTGIAFKDRMNAASATAWRQEPMKGFLVNKQKVHRRASCWHRANALQAT